MQVRRVLYNECDPRNTNHKGRKHKRECSTERKKSRKFRSSIENQVLPHSKSRSSSPLRPPSAIKPKSGTGSKKSRKIHVTTQRNRLYSSPAGRSSKKMKSEKSKSKSPIGDWTLKIPYSIRQKENKPLVSTRIPNERSLTDRTHKGTVKTSKKKKMQSTTRPRNKKQTKENRLKNLKPETHKARRGIAEIQTEFSQRRKQSYFDEIIFKQLNGQGESVGRGRCAESQIENQSETQKSIEKLSGNRDATTFRTYKSKIESYRDFGTSTESFKKDSTGQALGQDQGLELERERVEFFRKEQQLKWRVIHLGLQNFKILRKPETLQQIEKQSEMNLYEVQRESKKMHTFNKLTFQVMESPKIVQKALRDTETKKSVSQVSEIVRTLSNNKLLHELEFAEEMEELKVMKDSCEPQGNSKFSNSSFFCAEFEKQMEDFIREEKCPSPSDQVPNCSMHKEIICQQPACFPSQVHGPPQWQSERGEEVCEALLHSLSMQFCSQIWEYATVFHKFLQHARALEQPMEKIAASNTYTWQLADSFFSFILQSPQLIAEVLSRLNSPYGKPCQLLLKQIQNSYKQNEENIEVDGYEAPLEIISAEVLGEFDVQTHKVPSEDQYFYNHCVYGCLNELLDQHRPYGLLGIPPLTLQVPKMLLNRDLEGVLRSVQKQLVELMDVRMGRIDFQAHEDCILETQKVYDRMDRYFVAEEGIKWKYLENILENQMFLSLVVFDQIVSEEVIMIFRLIQ